MSARWDVIGVGANSIDFVYRLPGRPAFDAPQTKMRIAGRATWCGGQVATALAACAALGLRTKYIGAVGNDEHGRRMLRELSGRGIDIEHVVTRECENAYAVILVDDASGERIVLWDRPAALALTPDDLPADILASARLVHVDDVDQPAAIAAARLARGAGLHVTSDIDRITDQTWDLLRSVTVAILAEHVPAALTGERDADRALVKLRRGCAGMLCVTRGRRGAVLLDGDRVYRAPALDVRAVDTTAAGDVFRGGFIRALLAGWPPEAVLHYANAAAGVSCTRDGAMNSVPSPADMHRFGEPDP
jgi:sugar/nucleoside kinase (ribokinase family)